MRRLSVALDVVPLVGPRTGVGTFVAGLLGALSGRQDLAVEGYAVTTASRRDLAASLVPLLGPRARLHHLRVPTRVVLLGWRATGLPGAEWLAPTADVVHGTNYVVAPARGRGRVVTVHDTSLLRHPEWCAGATRAYLPALRRAVLEGAFVHTHSRFTAGEVVELLGVPPERVRAIPPGIVIEEEPVGGEVPRRSGKRRYVLALGAAERRKGLEVLVEAFAALVPGREDLELVLAGPDGPATPEVVRAVAARGLDQRVRRLGYVDDATRSALLADAAVLAYPSLDEGFGLPPLEAMAAGVPVVASRAGALPEVLDGAAILVEPSDPDALAAGLARVLDDPAAARDLATRGRQHAARYRWEDAAEAFAHLYRDVAAASGRAGRRPGGSP